METEITESNPRIYEKLQNVRFVGAIRQENSAHERIIDELAPQLQQTNLKLYIVIKMNIWTFGCNTGIRWWQRPKECQSDTHPKRKTKKHRVVLS